MRPRERRSQGAEEEVNKEADKEATKEVNKFTLVDMGGVRDKA